MDSEHKPKGKYTVSAKVLAANRENLKKALAARKPALPPRQAAFNCPFIWDHVRRWGRKAAATLKRQGERLVGVILPPQDAQHKKLSEAMAQGVGSREEIRGREHQLPGHRAGFVAVTGCRKR
jgi:hypothetical protein